MNTAIQNADGLSKPTTKVLSLLNASIHKIDINQQDVSLPFADMSKEDLKKYIENVISEVVKSPKSQKFKFDDEFSKIPEIIKSLVTEDFTSNSTLIARKLHTCEIAAQLKYKAITELREGSLLCAHLILDSQEFMLMVKIDHANFLDDIQYTKTTGLPEKQRAQKTATIEIISGELDTTVIISDSGTKITEYWWKDFLNLLPLSSAEKNTEKAFRALEALLIRKLKDKSQCDFWTLRNAAVSYFTTRQNCIFPDMIDELLDGFEPDDKTLKLGKLKEDAKKLPESKDFDSHFVIVKSVIKARIKKQIRLAENLELQIKGEIPGYDKLFSTGEDTTGKFLKIYSDTGYEVFHKSGNIS